MPVITEDQFEATYKPIQNHLNPDAAFGGQMFETYGPEYAFVLSRPLNTVWTIVEGDDGKLFYMAANHYVNRIGYLITEVPWETGEEEVEIEGVPEDEMSEEDFEAKVDEKLAEVRAQYGETIGPKEAYRIARDMVKAGPGNQIEVN